MENKNMFIYINAAGQKIKTNGLTMNQNSTNNVLYVITIGTFASMSATFKLPVGNIITEKYHFIPEGKYELTDEDTESILIENADNLYKWSLNIPLTVTSTNILGTSSRINVSISALDYDSNNYLKQAMTASASITINQASTTETLDESYSSSDVENLWKAVGNLQSGKQDSLPTVVNDRYLHTNSTTGELEWSVVEGGGGGSYTAGVGIDITNSVISVDHSTVAYLSDLPTKTSDLTNDSNYVNTTQLATKQNVLTAGTGINITGDTITATGTIAMEVVEVLPAVGESGKIYLLRKASPGSQDIYDEYIYVNSTWEKIGSTQIDLTNYYTKTQVDSALANKQNTLTQGSNITISGNTISATDTTYDSDRGIINDSNTFKLRQDFYDYLLQQVYQRPTTTLVLLDADGNVIADSYPSGTSVTISKIRHTETNISNISGTLTLYKDNVSYHVGISASSTATIVDIADIILDGSTNCTIKLYGVDTNGNSFTATKTISFVAATEYDYWYQAASYISTYDSSTMLYKDPDAEFTMTSVANTYIFALSETKTSGSLQSEFGYWYDIPNQTALGQRSFTNKDGVTKQYYVYQGPLLVESGSTMTLRLH